MWSRCHTLVEVFCGLEDSEHLSEDPLAGVFTSPWTGRPIRTGSGHLLFATGHMDEVTQQASCCQGAQCQVRVKICGTSYIKRDHLPSGSSKNKEKRNIAFPLLSQTWIPLFISFYGTCLKSVRYSLGVLGDPLAIPTRLQKL